MRLIRKLAVLDSGAAICLIGFADTCVDTISLLTSRSVKAGIHFLHNTLQ